MRAVTARLDRGAASTDAIQDAIDTHGPFRREGVEQIDVTPNIVGRYPDGRLGAHVTVYFKSPKSGAAPPSQDGRVMFNLDASSNIILDELILYNEEAIARKALIAEGEAP